MKKNITNYKKIEIVNRQNPILLFLKNIRYLFKYSLKQMYKEPNINIGEVTELAAIKTRFIWDEIKVPKIKNDMETIHELVNTNKSIIRFGNGEINLMLGEDSLFEPANDFIKNTFKEIFYNNDEDLLTGTRYDMFRINTNFMHSNINTFRLQYFLTHYEKMKELYNYNKTYYSACFVYPYNIYEEWDLDEQFDEMRKIWSCKNITVIAGSRVFKNIKYNVFDNAHSISYIYGPNMNALQKYDELKEKIFNVSKDNILIFALGPCGKILAYNAYKSGYRVLDMGHLIKNYDFYKKRDLMSVKEFKNNFRTFMKPD